MPACIQNQFCGAYGYVGLVNVFRVNYFILKGLSATQRIEIKNAARGPSQELGMGLLVSNAFDMLHNMLRGDGFKGKWLSVHDNTGAGIAVSTWKNWIVIQTVWPRSRRRLLSATQHHPTTSRVDISWRCNEPRRFVSSILTIFATASHCIPITYKRIFIVSDWEGQNPRLDRAFGFLVAAEGRCSPVSTLKIAQGQSAG